ncbi:hypothetical protein A2533_00730 [Candidatus Falkowbacteria bacterium RIFOXYD2_FULL_35_9]|uniref:Uncharacterized protein n=1 Tax=Candidatus Falkowbacteria bacterium RIFOXYC2_FULL_36_12 TaxID=1798002 RepID=A0A1F5T309_9BACT|nr:MAG: hypothetical protein A2300_04350 [Candidatus Falkowbacteria bacterium RIFOXYB2_FULL_35_7]OGF33083.1 MAG: hypothetical protein A2223_05095 [Candidatus Falkowbacteria bacterium RIFOXYA2_FULL_35_8]OGF33355.1 MAG: hypothetical protein A2478_01485 [Candidatus Falkowbacteria bacterium RIFOXYC2_FULL_36_12]OGF45600.1 MAG: hypothetical protein A2533_00730 [Candidatus Falkowbacteria bacterium RIFOXYD2_FULL_35_9]
MDLVYTLPINQTTLTKSTIIDIIVYHRITLTKQKGKESEMRETLSIIAGILFVIGFVPYVIAILRKETKPEKATWIIWATLDSLTLAGMYYEETVNGQIVGAVLGVWIVVFFAMKYGTPGWTLLDKACLMGAVIGIALWQIFSDPLFGIMTSLVVVSLGSIPTFVSAWEDPSKENKLAWVIFWVSSVLAVITIPHWTLEDAAQPITFCVVESIMMYILFSRNQKTISKTSVKI